MIAGGGGHGMAEKMQQAVWTTWRRTWTRTRPGESWVPQWSVGQDVDPGSGEGPTLYIAWWEHTWGEYHGLAGVFGSYELAVAALETLGPRSDWVIQQTRLNAQMEREGD